MTTVDARAPELPRYFDAAAAVTMLAAVAYLVGYSYFAAYYEALGFGEASIVLTTTSYIRESLLPLFVSICLLAFANIKATSSDYPRAMLFLQNAAFLPLSAFILMNLRFTFAQKHLSMTFVDALIIFALLVFCAFGVYSSYRKEYIVDNLGIPSRWRLVAAVALVVYASVSEATLLGAYQASAAMRDRFPLRPRFVIQTASLELKSLELDNLILVLSQDDTYYVLDLPQNTNSKPVPYIIPAEQVTAAHFKAKPQ